jgi:phosphate starvation-inducible protein PhoH
MESSHETRLSRKERRQSRQERRGGKNSDSYAPSIKTVFKMEEIDPLTDNQRITFDAYEDGKNLMLHGIAGTGKTFISLYLSLRELLSEDSQYKKIYIVRSVVPTRDMGFLPGSASEKAKVYEAPYYAICTELFGKSTSYDALKQKNLIEFISTSFIRGITLNDCIVIVDECQNATSHELDSVITRVGKNCRIIFAGDFTQSDFVHERDKNGVTFFMKVIKKIKSFEFVEFTKEDILRSDLVKDYIIEKDRLGITM